VKNKENIMKKTVLLVVVSILMVIASAAFAEVKSGSFSFTPFVGGYVFEGNEDLKNTIAYGVRAGYQVTDNVGVEGFFTYVPTEIKNAVDADIKMYSYGIEGLFHFMPDSRFVPFLAAGIGGIYYDTPSGISDKNKFAVDYGAGLKIFVTDTIALRADVRHVIPFNDRYNDFLATFGITFSFGGGKKEASSARVEEPYVAPKPAPAPVVAEPVVVEEPAATEVEAPIVEATVAVPVVSATETAQAVERFTPEQEIEIFVSKWLASWESGDMETYRNCYSDDFRSKGMDLSAWIAYKESVRRRSENIRIKIENLQISADEQTATAKAAFTQYYSSSVLIDKGNKTLFLKKINEDWKIFRENFVPIK
jgi:outer membrane beta-barrel protein